MKKDNISAVKLNDLFKVKSGDFHATKELDPGNVPLISCGDSNNGFVGNFDVPEENIYRNCITVAYNGLPLTAKFHPYRFGAKDDIAVLIPRFQMKETTLLFIATILNMSTWRYSYGRKCFRQKLQNFSLNVPIINKQNKSKMIDEEAISNLFSKKYKDFLPKKSNEGIKSVPSLKWKPFNVKNIFKLNRGDFHSIASLSIGDIMTVSRVSEENGVVGYYELPEGASIYDAGFITVSTVSGDAFVQLDKFIATDNVIICIPKQKLRNATLFFISFMLNYQKWRYSYGRQCYLKKFEKAIIYLPITSNKQEIDEDVIERIVYQTSYWDYIKNFLIIPPLSKRDQ